LDAHRRRYVAQATGFGDESPIDRSEDEPNRRRHSIAEEQAEGEEMSDPRSLSIFTMEADRKPIAVFAAKKHQDAEAFFDDERVRAKLQAANSGGVPLIDDRSILRVRLANAVERVRYREKAERSTEKLGLVFLVDIDGLGS
jgi:hypothetical protein